MKITSASFHRSCSKAEQFPEYPYPEFAFFGRSNVGKSSLINMITGTSDLCKTGSQPGVTRTVNFFLINNNISFADLPGYGYAKLPKRVASGFVPLIASYIRTRNSLKLALLLFDIRRKPDDRDKRLIELLVNRGVPVAIIVTKSDKVSRNKRKTHLREICAGFGIGEESTIFTSSHTGEGKNDMLRLIEEYRSRR